MRLANMELYVGQLVLYTNLGDADGEYPPEQQPAVVTRINEDGTAAITIFYPTGIFQMQDVAYSPTPARRHISPVLERPAFATEVRS